MFVRFYLHLVLALSACALLVQIVFADTCPTQVASNDPSTCLPSSWSNVLSSGNYCTSSTTDNIYWQVSVQTASGVQCTSTTLNNGPYTKRYCTVVQADIASTPENETQLRVVYADTAALTCPSGYQISSGKCNLISTCPVTQPVNQCPNGGTWSTTKSACLCEDGFPPDVYGTPDFCDRIKPKQCSDGSYVPSTTGVCTKICSDYASCLEYASSNANCQSGSIIDFKYTDPNNFTYTCTTISTTSPDNPTNGGDGDGNPFNDPATPTTGTGSTPSVGDIDPQSLASAIGSELSDYFGAIESAVRSVDDDVRNNTDTLDSSLSDIADINSEGFGSVVDAVQHHENQTVGGLYGIEQSVGTLGDTLGSKLDEISGKLDSDNCVASEANNYCENPHGLSGDFISSIYDALQGTMDSEKQTASDTVKGEITQLQDEPPLGSELVDGVFDYFLNWIPQPANCVPLEFGQPSEPFYFVIGCDASDKFKQIFGFLISVYTMLQLVEILMTGIRPKLSGGA